MIRTQPCLECNNARTAIKGFIKRHAQAIVRPRKRTFRGQYVRNLRWSRSCLASVRSGGHRFPRHRLGNSRILVIKIKLAH